MSKGKVFLGMSGGVDSSVSAALLKQAGYSVVGIFIRVWEPPGFPCTWRSDRRDAMRVAALLNIPLITLDLEARYKQEVVDYLVSEYAQGRTPNPDVMCNKNIKFGAFYDWAMEQGADYVATGHYAQIKDGKLLMSKDQNKDQTYFLWTLKVQQLNHILFPVGHLNKSKVRELAIKFKLPNAKKRDSQGLCFIGKMNIKNFLQSQIKTSKGPIFNERGEWVGEHDGAILYTIGERHGFRIEKKTPDDKPYYIIAKDLLANALAVSQNQKIIAKTNPKEIRLDLTNWFKEPKIGEIGLKARIRHRGELSSCRLIKNGKKCTVKFTTKPPLALASGQSLVIYKGRECLGGGTIII